MPYAVAACALAAIAWLYLLAARGGYWRTDQRLPAGTADPGRWPSVAAVIPARDEAAMLPATLPTLLGQDYAGPLRVVLVDDDSTDGTAQVAAAVSQTVRVISGSATPSGWAGKVWAMAQGLQAAGDAEYILFTDADIAYQQGTVAALVRAAEGDHRVLVSQMALLRAETGWERLLVPAFVYFFAMLYPFRLVNRPGARVAAAAGGCMLVRRQALEAAGGLDRIRGARIDDVALGRLLKRSAAGRCWLGLTTAVRSRRPYPDLSGLWDMVARSAYTQLRYSPAALAGTVAGLLWLYLLPPAAVLAGLTGLAGGSSAAGWPAAAGLAAWTIMSITYLPMLRLYGLSPLRAPSLPVIAVMYAAMTADSARRHHRGRGGEWKGRTIKANRAGTSSAEASGDTGGDLDMPC